MVLRIFSILVLFLFCVNADAQHGNVTGTVVSEGKPVPFAAIGISGTSRGVAGDMDGKFSLVDLEPGQKTIMVSAVGYARKRISLRVEPDTVIQITIELERSVAELGEVVITGGLRESYVADSPVKIEVLTHKALKTTPVVSVIEAVNMVNGVQEQIGCGVCGTNDIHINGMEGPYTLVLIDGMPLISGLGSVYGFNGIPTSIIERIEVIKGPSSSLYGTEAVGGVINVITFDPDKVAPAGFNSFITSHREWSADFFAAPTLKKSVKALFSGSIFHNDLRIDENRDNFTDIPLNQRVSFFNKWSFGNPQKVSGSLAGRLYLEDRFGGEMNWTEEQRGGNLVYGESIRTSRYELFGKYRNRKESTTYGADLSASYHYQDSWYGNTSFLAEQAIFYSNFLINKRSGRHDFTAGLTGRLEQYEDNTAATFNAVRVIPGVFAQDEYAVTSTFTALPGFRLDYNSGHGLIFSPRLSLKKDVGKYTDIRLNSGTGFRQVNLFTEDHAALTGSRKVVLAEALRPEKSINFNLGVHHVFQSFLGSGTFDCDLFYTRFGNKIVPDYNTDPNLIIYENLDGHGVSRGASVSISNRFEFPLTIHAGGTWQKVYEMSPAGLEIPQLFAPVFTGNWSAGYEIKKLSLKIDYVGKVTGPQHLPEFSQPYVRPEKSDWFTLQNLQLTWKKGKAEFYTGLKNIFGFTQDSPLIAPDQPFGPDFDTSYAWGPLQSRRFFVGLRYHFERK